MDKVLDLRIQKTYIALMASFSELLKKKRFEKITVNEICDNAMVRRATFYKHFADKYELFAFMVRDIQNSYNAQAQVDGITGGRLEQYIAISDYMLTFLEENEELVSSVMRSDLFPILFDILFEQITMDVKQRLCKDTANESMFSLSPDFMAEAFTGALLSICKWWIRNSRSMKKEKVMEQITILLKNLHLE